MTNLLALDTSSPVLSIALKKGSKETTESKLVGFLKHAENLLPMIDVLLKKEGLSIDEIDTFLINRGPGSFTGLRIGFATLKGFLAAKSKPSYGGLSLDLIADGIKDDEGTKLLVALDARRERFFVRQYIRCKNSWLPQDELKILLLNEFLEFIPKHAKIAGDALTRYEEKIKASCLDKDIVLLSEDTWHPKASTLIQWFEDKRTNLLELKKPDDFLPFYVRSSEAEERREENARNA